MNDNKVADWQEVDKLSTLTTLHTVYLERNPIWNDPSEPHRGMSIMLQFPPVVINDKDCFEKHIKVLLIRISKQIFANILTKPRED